MRNILIILALLSLAGCNTSTQYGPCIGAFDEKDPKKIYKLDEWNLVMAIIFFEVIAPPVVVVANETFCPVGNK